MRLGEAPENDTKRLIPATEPGGIKRWEAKSPASLIEKDSLRN